MKKLIETFRVYRELPLFQSLLDSLEELGEEGLMPLELIPGIVQAYDKAIFQEVNQSSDEYTVTGAIKAYRINRDFEWWMLNDVKIQKQKKGRNVNFCHVKKLKVMCHQPVRGEDLVITRSDNPYVIEVEPVVQKKETKLKLKTIKELNKEKEKEKIGVFDPRAHITGIQGDKSSQGSSRDKSFLRPMPYNEKLRLGGRENSLAIAETQVTTMEVLRGRYRKAFREYPTRRITSLARRKIDIEHDFLKSNGLRLALRKYEVIVTSQDRFVAEMALAASGSLSLLGHNIHVVGGERERGLVRREQISTRRKQKIQDVSYDVKNNYELVKTPVGNQVSDSSSESSDTSAEEDLVRPSSRTRSKTKKRRMRADLKLRKKRGKDEPTADVPDKLITKQNIKVEAADEENNEMDDKVALLLKVEPLDYDYQQEEFKEFFSVQEAEPGQQMDQEEANELLGFLAGPQEKSVEDILFENVLGVGEEEMEERPQQETLSEAGSEPGRENSVSDLSIISEFNMLS